MSGQAPDKVVDYASPRTTQRRPWRTVGKIGCAGVVLLLIAPFLVVPGFRLYQEIRMFFAPSATARFVVVDASGTPQPNVTVEFLEIGVRIREPSPLSSSTHVEGNTHVVTTGADGRAEVRFKEEWLRVESIILADGSSHGQRFLFTKHNVGGSDYDQLGGLGQARWQRSFPPYASGPGGLDYTIVLGEPPRSLEPLGPRPPRQEVFRVGQYWQWAERAAGRLGPDVRRTADQIEIDFPGGRRLTVRRDAALNKVGEIIVDTNVADPATNVTMHVERAVASYGRLIEPTLPDPALAPSPPGATRPAETEREHR